MERLRQLLKLKHVSLRTLSRYTGSKRGGTMLEKLIVVICCGLGVIETAYCSLCEGVGK